METLFDVHYGDFFETTGEGSAPVTVEPVHVIRRGVLPGCSRETLTVRYKNGRVAHTSCDMFHSTEAAAWDSVKRDIADTIQLDEKEIISMQKRVANMKSFLSRLN